MSDSQPKVLTQGWQITQRSYSLFGQSLGHGAERGLIVWSTLVLAVWSIVVVVFFWPLTAELAVFYLGVPVVVIALGWNQSKNCARRKVLTQTILAMRWIFQGGSVSRWQNTRPTSTWLHRLVFRVRLAFNRESDLKVRAMRSSEVDVTTHVIGADHMEKLRKSLEGQEL